MDMNAFTNWLKEAGLDAKKHQLSGMKWVHTRETNPRLGVPGGFLCDEMGLGKTILMIGTIVLNPSKQTLVVMPRALIQQWAGALKKFANIDTFVYHGANAKRLQRKTLPNLALS